MGSLDHPSQRTCKEENSEDPPGHIFPGCISSCRALITLKAPVYRAVNHIVGTTSQTHPPMAQTQPSSNFHFSGPQLT